MVDHRILVTNQIDDVLEAIRLIDSSRYFVDNEQNSEHETIAMSMVSAASNLGILYYGRDVKHNEGRVYELLTVLDTVCYCWDRRVEKNYPNLIDLQRLAFETGFSNDREQLSLRDYSEKMAITHKRSIADFNIFERDIIPG